MRATIYLGTAFSIRGANAGLQYRPDPTQYRHSGARLSTSEIDELNDSPGSYRPARLLNKCRSFTDTLDLNRVQTLSSDAETEDYAFLSNNARRESSQYAVARHRSRQESTESRDVLYNELFHNRTSLDRTSVDRTTLEQIAEIDHPIQRQNSRAAPNALNHASIVSSSPLLVSEDLVGKQGTAKPYEIGATRSTDSPQNWYTSTLQVAGNLEHRSITEFDDMHLHDFLQKLSLLEHFAHIEILLSESTKKLEQTLDMNAWLLRAIWWLLKSQATRQSSKNREDRSDTAIYAPLKDINSSQGIVDYLKSCFIIKMYIFAESQAGTQVTDEVWKAIQDLASALSDEFDAIEWSDVSPKEIAQQQILFTERIHQPVEHFDRMPRALDTKTSPAKWLTVVIGDAGADNDHIYLRTFVNAQIGPVKRERRWSTGAPYLLILWSRSGRSEYLISLINQHGTVNLERAITTDDLTQFEALDPLALEFDFEFPSQKATIAFLSRQEFDTFLGLPKAFLDRIEGHDPEQDEFLMFRDSLQSFQMRSLESPREVLFGHKSHVKARFPCELSLYQKIPNECWKTERRLVITSAPDDHQPRCNSYWLPLGDVQVHAEDRDVEISWPNCADLVYEKKNYVTKWSYIYNPDQSNMSSINVVFENAEAARLFAAAILHPFDLPFHFPSIKFDHAFGRAMADQNSEIGPNIQTSARELQVWRIKDLDGKENEDYVAVISIEQRPNSKKVADVYFLYRDLDFLLHDTEATIEIRKAGTPYYHSTITDMNYEPKQADGEPQFSGQVELVDKVVRLPFANMEGVQQLLRSIIRWNLKFVCRAKASVAKSRMSSKEYDDVVVALWESFEQKQKEGRLSLRIETLGVVKWITASVSTNNYSPDSKKKQFSFENLEIQRGNLLDGKELMAYDVSNATYATDSNATPEAQAIRRLTITPKKALHCWQFDDKMRNLDSDWQMVQSSSGKAHTSSGGSSSQLYGISSSDLQ